MTKSTGKVIGRAAVGEAAEWMFLHLRRTHSAVCIPWPFAYFDTGYACFNVDGKVVRAHRYVCRWTRGAPSSPKHDAAHSCGNRACVNPAHLRWATKKENEADKLAQGRPHGPRGTVHGMARLTPDEVRSIRAARGPQTAIAAKYGVCQQTISDITARRTWAHLT